MFFKFLSYDSVQPPFEYESRQSDDSIARLCDEIENGGLIPGHVDQIEEYPNSEMQTPIASPNVETQIPKSVIVDEIEYVSDLLKSFRNDIVCTTGGTCAKDKARFGEIYEKLLSLREVLDKN